MPRNGKALVVHEGDTVLVVETKPGTDNVLTHSEPFPIVAKANGRILQSAVIGRKVDDRVDVDPLYKGRTVIRAMSFLIKGIMPNPLMLPKRPLSFKTAEAQTQAQ